MNTNNQPETKINDQIRANTVRLIDADGTQLGILSRAEALAKARQVGLDLVAVSDKTDPPVCKILDYGKFRYEQQKKLKEAAKKNRLNNFELKELRLKPSTAPHDLGIKVRKALEFLEIGHKVMFVVRFKGRELSHKDKGYELLQSVQKELDEIAVVDRGPLSQGTDLAITFSPKSK